MGELTQRERFLGTLLGEKVDRFPTVTVPSLLESGRYLPCLDDRPRSNVPLSHYRFYRTLLKDIAFA